MNLLETNFFEDKDHIQEETKKCVGNPEELKIEIERLIKETRIEDLPNLVFELITDPPPWRPWN